MSLRDCVVRFFRFIAIVFNVVFVLVALVLITIGATFMSVAGTEAKQSYDLGVICLILGCVIFFVSFLGCYGAQQKNRCMLVSYVLVVLLIFFAQMVLAIMAFVSVNNMSGHVEKNLLKMKEDYYADNNVRNRFDFVQTKFKCCGSGGVEDWGTKIPQSCCGDPERICGKNSSFVDGCNILVADYLKNLAGIIGYVAIVCGLVEISGGSLAVFMLLIMKKSDGFMIVPK